MIVERASEVVTITSAAVEAAVGPRLQSGRTGQMRELMNGERRFLRGGGTSIFLAASSVACLILRT